VFTAIALDHTAILGADIEAIARTKAGIIKPGSTVVSASQEPAALAEILEAAEHADARLFVAGRDFELLDDRLAVGGRQLVLRGLHGHDYDPAFVPLYGAHQSRNVSLAVAAAEAFFGGERPIPEEVLDEGLSQLTSPGRLHLIGNEPTVYVDSAHNPHGAEALAEAVTESFAFSELALVAGSLSDKDAAGLFETLLPIAELVFLTPIDSPRSLSASQLATIVDASEAECTIEVTETMHEALEAARAWAMRAEGRGVLVAGSVLLAGEAIRHARDEGWAAA